MFKLCITVAVTVAVTFGWASSGYAATPKKERVEAVKQRLDRGVMVVKLAPVSGSVFPAVNAMAVVEAPIDRVWEVVRDCGNLSRLTTTIASSRRLSLKGRKSRCQVTVDMPLMRPLVSVTNEVDEPRRGSKRVHRWTLTRGDYDRNEGSWTLMPFDDAGKRTLVVYRNHIEPRVSVPAALYRGMYRKRVRGLLQGVRRLSTSRR